MQIARGYLRDTCSTADIIQVSGCDRLCSDINIIAGLGVMACSVYSWCVHTYTVAPTVALKASWWQCIQLSDVETRTVSGSEDDSGTHPIQSAVGSPGAIMLLPVPLAANCDHILSLTCSTGAQVGALHTAYCIPRTEAYQ